MDDKEIAIAHLTLMDAETPEEVNTWREHWRRVFDGMLTAEHYGDCTKTPSTCVRCVADEAMKMVPVYRSLFKIEAT